MNKTLQDILTRRSVRRYRPDPVPEELLDRIIEAGLYAASAKNHQSSVIIAVTDKELIARMSETNRIIWGKPEGCDPFYGAPAVLVVLDRKDWRNAACDGALVLGNMMLAAHALGLGSCWINRAEETFEQEGYKALLRELGLEGEYVGIGNCIVGYTDGEEPAAPPRREGRVFRIRQAKA